MTGAGTGNPTATITIPGGLGVNAVQTLQFTNPAPGTQFTLTFNGATTAPISYNTVSIPAKGATEAANTVTITTSTANNFTIGEMVTIVGLAVPAYNGTFLITATPTPTTFQYIDPTANLAVSGNGTANTLVSNIQAALDALLDHRGRQHRGGEHGDQPVHHHLPELRWPARTFPPWSSAASR